MNTETPPSETPETDAAEFFTSIPGFYIALVTFSDHARELERQRNALRAFAKEVVQVHLCDCGVLDLQDIATIHGLLYGGHPTPLLTGEK